MSIAWSNESLLFPEKEAKSVVPLRGRPSPYPTETHPPKKPIDQIVFVKPPIF
jgi:hypothetical protein